MPPTFPHRIQDVVLFVCNQLFCILLRGFHSLWRAIPGNFESAEEAVRRHHISYIFLCKIRVVFFRFRSPLLTESLLISFPPLTEML